MEVQCAPLKELWLGGSVLLKELCWFMNFVLVSRCVSCIHNEKLLLQLFLSIIYNLSEDQDGINELFDHSFFEGVMSEIKRINIFFQGKYFNTMKYLYFSMRPQLQPP